MIQVIDQRKGTGSFMSEPESNINVTIINNSVVKVNGKYLIRTHLNDWVRQDAVWTAEEIDASKLIIKRINAGRK